MSLQGQGSTRNLFRLETTPPSDFHQRNQTSRKDVMAISTAVFVLVVVLFFSTSNNKKKKKTKKETAQVYGAAQ